MKESIEKLLHCIGFSSLTAQLGLSIFQDHSGGYLVIRYAMFHPSLLDRPFRKGIITAIQPAREKVPGNTFREPLIGAKRQANQAFSNPTPFKGRSSLQGSHDRKETGSTVIAKKEAQFFRANAGGTTSAPLVLHMDEGVPN